jgi:uncharacterized protein YbjT (DUF2867 family)
VHGKPLCGTKPSNQCGVSTYDCFWRFGEERKLDTGRRSNGRPRLLSKRQSVRVLVRPPSNYQPLIDAGAQAVIGDLKNRSSLDPACKDIEVLITTATSAKRGGDDNPKTVDLEGNRNLIDAAKVAGVKQFIFVSASIAHPNSPIPLMQAKGATEEYLRASGIPYTIIAPDAFMDFWVALVVGMPAVAGQPVMVIGTGDRKHSFIFSIDVTKFIIASINNPRAKNQKLVMGGPEALSFREAVAVFEQVLGRKILVQSVAFGQPLPGFPDAMAEFIGGLDTFDSLIDTTEISRTFGVKLTSLEEFAKGFVAGAKS